MLLVFGVYVQIEEFIHAVLQCFITARFLCMRFYNDILFDSSINTKNLLFDVVGVDHLNIFIVYIP